MLKVILEEEVKRAIKNTYIRLRKGKKEAFDKVEIDDAQISSTGIFHVKLRHLEDFLRYDIFKSFGQQTGEDIAEKYALLYGLDMPRMKKYYLLWEEAKNQMESIKSYCVTKRYHNIFDKLLEACGKMDVAVRARKFGKLANIKPNDNLLEDKILDFKRCYESFLNFEENDKLLVKTVNDTIRNTLTSILKDPLEVYYHIQRYGSVGDFVFCSDKYGIELILVLKTRKTKTDAELFTAYSEKYNEVLNSNRKGVWQKIYSRQDGCLIK